ncbi:SDR family NAD(P)-dependent oxidoreductase [Maricaulis sp.]|uniref:SDR family NAD(P)-dependent oxidoreductase n=1 Tax=Maricaulis sp. TaxID=1486257 RepID=UPI003A936DCC
MTETSHPVILITGGSRGLGRSMALHLARLGADIILIYQGAQQEAGAVIAEIGALGRRGLALQLDIGDTSGFPGFVDALREVLERQWGGARLDGLVNNAGVGVNKPFAGTSEAEFDQLMSLHLKGVFFLTQSLLGLIRNGGHILNLSTGLTRFTHPGFAAYAAMKGAVEVLTRYLALELGPRGIRVNTIAPGAIETDFGGGLVRDNPAVNSGIAAATALGRAGLPDDIGGAVASVLLGDFGWMTGQRLELSGGQSL